MMSTQINVAVGYRHSSAAVSVRQRHRADFDHANNQAAPATRQPERAEDRFGRLFEEWTNDTMFTSSITQVISHPAYLAIIGMGERAVPLILENLRRAANHWAPALTAITGVNPVPQTRAGDMQAIADAWITWGRVHGHLK